MRKANVHVWVENEQLRYKGPKSALTPEVLAEMRSFKSELFEICRQSNNKPRRLPLTPIPRDGRLPISLAQQRLWVLDQLEGPGPTYNIARVLRLRGPLDGETLGQSLNAVIDRHETLRTTFHADDEGVRQVIAPSATAALQVVDVQHLAAEERLAEVRRQVRDQALQPFDLEAGPLVRFVLFKVGDEDHVLMTVTHHIISDGRSIEVLMDDIGTFYRAFAEGRQPGLPELPIQYVDYAYYQRQWMSDDVLAPQLDYWKRQLDGLPPLLELPADRPRPPVYSAAGSNFSHQLNADLVRELKQIAQQSGTTLFAALLAGMAAFLSRYTGRDDIAVGCPVTQRDRPEIESLIGFFINTLVLRVDVSGNPSFSELLLRARDVLMQGFANQNVPFEKIVEQLDLERDTSYPPLVQVAVMFMDRENKAANLPGLETEPVDFVIPIAKFDLNVEMYACEDGVDLLWIYNSDLFDHGTVARMAKHLENLLRGAAARPDAPLADLPLLDEAERRRMLVDWNDARVDDLRDRCLHQLVEDQVRRTPHAVAVESGDRQLTYQQLNDKANRLAHYLRTLEVGSDTPVAICVDRSLEMVVAVLGILKAGGAYVPLDPNYPRERLELMVTKSRAPVLLTQKKSIDGLPSTRARIVCLDTDWEQIASGPAHDLSAPYRPEDLCYVIFTSGSTGQPKAAALEHRALANLILWQLEQQPDYRAGRTLQFASLSFDASFQEMFSTWCCGGTLVLVADDVRRDAPALLDFLIDHKIERLFLPFVALHHLAEVAESSGTYPTSLREVLPSGEQLQITPAISNLFKRLDGCVMQNLYGPTETHVVTAYTLGPAVDDWPVLPPIGRAISNCQLYVLDGQLRPVPIGVRGELYIGGICLARGYLHDAERTAERFVNVSIDGGPPSRLYRTGDMVRYLDDGNIEFLGRADHQVKIRGFRVELAEIEAVLSRHVDVADAAVVVRGEGVEDKQLVAYVVTTPGCTSSPNDWIGFLKAQLPEYMLPAYFVTLDALPLTPTGKVDRRSLPAPNPEDMRAEESYVAPRSATEEVLVGIWSEVLGQPKIGVQDDFFHRGGHSLLATQLMSRVYHVFGVKLPVRLLFQSPTLAEMAIAVDAARRADETCAALPIERIDRDCDLPLSFAQQRLWLLEQLEGATSTYTIPAALRLKGKLKTDVLQRSLQELVRRHESLRTTFESVDGVPRQKIHEDSSLRIAEIDLRHLAGGRQAAETKAFIADETRRPFDLVTGPLLRVALVVLAEDEQVLVVTMHHIVSDGWSAAIVVRELTSLYQAYANGEPSRLAELPIQYADFAAWQRRALSGDNLESQIDYWRQQLAGAPALLELPADRPRPPAQTYRGRTHFFELDQRLTEKLEAVSRQNATTLFMTLHAAFATLLNRYTGQDDVVIGSSIANRNRIETESLIGFFVNMLVLRTDLSGNPTFCDLLQRVRDVDLAAFDHQDVPFEKLVEELQPQRNLGHTPFFQVNLTFQNMPTEVLDLSELTVDWMELESTNSRFDFTVLIYPGDERLKGVVEYRTDLFDAATVERMIDNFQVLLEAVAADPQQGICQLPILTERERHQLVVQWNDTNAEYSGHLCIHQLFEAQAEVDPEAVAVVFENRHVTYGELNLRANQLAHRLIAAGVGPDVLVGICAERSLEMIVGLLGILKAGGAYVPLDPDYPADRLAYMLENAKASVLLTQSQLADRLPPHDGEVICLDTDWQEIAQYDGRNLTDADRRAPLTSDNLAYIIYTSGSTGRPKGVVLRHRPVVNLIEWVNRTFHVGRNDRVLFVTSVCFDLSVYDIFGLLAAGGSIHIATRDDLRDPARLVSLLCDQHITFWDSAPAALEQLAAFFPDRETGSRSRLRLVFLSGDWIPVSLPDRIRNAFPAAEVIGLGGATEAAIWSNFYPIREVDPCWTSIPYGRPISNARYLVLDEQLNPCPIGVAGELHIGGECLASGYANDPVQTAERFIVDPFSDRDDAVLYKTGDRTRVLADGNIEILGRLDHQVKIRGFRIEMGEIETVLGQHPDVNEVVVSAREDQPGNKRLVAYAVPRGSTGNGDRDGAPLLTHAAMRDYLQQRLPDYMIPAALVLIDKIPLTANGKVDRRQLPAPEMTGAAEEYVAPRTPTEENLATIQAGVLNLRRVGIHDNFFELGGHSLLATQFVARVRQAFAVDLPLRSIFESPTVAELATVVDAATATAPDASPPIERAANDEQLSLSFAQERLWFLDRLEPGNPFYNVPLALRLEGSMDRSALAWSLNEIARRHDVMRATFPESDGNPVLTIAQDMHIDVPVVDLSQIPDRRRTAELNQLIEDEARRPFDLTKGPLVRAKLVQCDDDHHVLLFTMHHIVSDGWSLGVLVRELAPLYLAFARGEDSPLEELPIQYADVASWQRKWLSGRVLEDQLGYWKTQLDGVPPLLELPSDRPRPPMQSYRGSSVRFDVDAAATSRLNQLSQRTGSTLYMTLLAAFASLLHRYSGQDDIVVGSPIANRTRAEMENLVGFFVNTLAMRADLHGNPTFEELLARLREVALDAYAHQDLPFERLIDEIQPERDLSINPLFQVMFSLQNAPLDALELPDLKIEIIETKRVAALFDMVLDMWEDGAGLIGVLEYNTDLFDEPTIDRFVASFQHLLQAVAADPQCHVADLPLIQADDAQALIELGTGPRISYPVDRTIHELFETAAARDPDRIAAVHNGREFRYRDLQARSSQIAHRLRGFGVKRQDIVAILDQRGLDTLAAMLGILKAGGAFLPIDAGYPRERIEFMLADSRAETLITSAAQWRGADLQASCPHLRHVLVLDEDDLAGEPVTGPEPVNSSRDLAYVLYTSGSTGVPKGAMVRHDGAVNHMFAEFDLLSFHRDTAFLQSAPSSSDISVWQFLAPSLVGGWTVIADFEIVCDPARLFHLIRSERVTLIELVPVVMAELLDYVGNLSQDERQLPDLEWAMATGEAVPVSLIRKWIETYRAIPIVNAYGPTEAADDICQLTIDAPLPPERRTVPIGRPLANLALYVLDSNLRLVPRGVVGEICVSGIGVGAGYLGDASKSAAAFVANPHGHGTHQTLYRTGDLGRWLPSGDLECLERLDHQVKVRGFRIELGEIEGMLGGNPAVREAVVVARDDPSGDKQLVGYVVPDTGSEEIRRQLDALRNQQIDLWQDLHEDSYRDSLVRGDVTFNVIGWDSNYTGAPLPEVDMREYVDFSIERILSLSPRRVLEIGCGTGLIMFPLLPHCDRYTGTDLSSVSIEQLKRLRDSDELRGRIRGLDRAKLWQRKADDFDWIESGEFDTALLPSVVQYFPGIDYLLHVLEGLITKALSPDGAIFVGDVRSLSLLETFHTSVQLFKAEPSMSTAELGERVRRQLHQEQELAIDPRFFLSLVPRLEQISHVEILPKRGRHHNEMTRFRYDVLIHLGTRQERGPAPNWADWQPHRHGLPEIRRELTHRHPESLALRRVGNARVQRDRAAQTLLAQPERWPTVGDLTAALDGQEFNGLEPEHLWALGRELDYRVDISMASAYDDGSFDVVFTRNTETAASYQLAIADEIEPGTPAQYANNPLREKLASGLVPVFREYLKGKLPNYMVPALYELMDSLPLNPAGKVDRQQLPAPDFTNRMLAKDHVAPRNREEQVMADIWSEVLGVDRVGIHHNFFELGGHSLKATQVVSRIHRDLKTTIALRDVFNHPTIAELAATARVQEASDYATIPRTPDGEYYDLSHAQRRLWVLSQMEDSSVAYNMPAALLLEGEIDVEALQAAFSMLVLRHESLRTTFVLIDGKPKQRIHPSIDDTIRRVDLRNETDAEQVARQMAADDATAVFDLQRGPLVRASLLALGNRRHVLLLNMHHIISDDWSGMVLVREFVQLYQRFARGEPAELPPLRIQYRDYAAWQNEFLSSDAVAPHRDYWHRKLAGEIPVLNLPTDLPRPPVRTWNGDIVSFGLDPQQTKLLNAVGSRHNASLFMTLVALVKVLLFRLTRQEEIIVGFPIAGRNHADLEDQIGFYINTLPLMDRVRGELTFDAFLDEVKTTATEAYEHQVYPFDRLVDELKLSRDVSRSPMFDVVVVMQNVGADALSLEGVGIRPFATEFEASKFDLTFTFEEIDGGLRADVTYNSDLFLRQRIESICDSFEELIASALADPTKTILRLNILPKAARQKLLQTATDQTANYPAAHTLVEWFESQVRKTPDRCAVVFDESLSAGAATDRSAREELTYGQLNARANKLAHHLRALGIGPGQLVGICMQRSIDLVVGLLGILKAGGAYVPLDPAHPKDRLNFMLSDAGVSVVVAQAATAQGLAHSESQLVCIDEQRQTIDERPDDNPDCCATPGDTAYVIYTSGSTGQPKGVEVTHANVVRLFSATESWFEFNERDVWTMFHSYAFDFSVWELWGALLYGGRLVVVPQWVSRAPEAFYQTVIAEGVTVLNQTPSAFRQFMRVDEDNAVATGLSLRWVIFGGEALDIPALKSWFDRHGDRKPQLVNMYGITETTVHVTFRPLAIDDLQRAGSVIGRPIPDLNVFLLDELGQPVPVGVPGEIYVGGAGLAKGYLNRTELTKQRFVANPFSREPGSRLYRSGDLGRYLPDGDIEYLGRIDHQIQVRGFRVELGEIEAALGTHPDVREAVVTANGDPDDVRLIAYLILREQTTADASGLRHHLRQQLPDYMIPAAFVPMDAFPLTANGKLDRRALPRADDNRMAVEAEFVQPRNQLEMEISAVFQQLLRVDKVGINDNFFDLGAHSLLMVEAHRNLQERLGLKISVVDLFRYTTVRSLAEHLNRDDVDEGTTQIDTRAARQKAARKRRHKKRDRA